MIIVVPLIESSSKVHGAYVINIYQLDIICFAVGMIRNYIPVDNFGTVVGENPDCLLLSGTVVCENPDHVCCDVIQFSPMCLSVCAASEEGHVKK